MDASCGCGNFYHRPPIGIGSANRILKARVPISPAVHQQEGGDTKTKVSTTLASGDNVKERPVFQELDNKNSVELIGRSWAGDCIAFVIPEWDVGLDAGYIVQGKRLGYYFLTHVHVDHAHFMTHLKSRSKPPVIHLPAESVGIATNYLDASQQMTSHMVTKEEYDAFPWDKAYSFNGVRDGDRIVVCKKKGLICDVVRCDHSVPCLGYCFSRIKQKLKPEYQKLAGREIGKLRKSGVDVTYEEETPLLAFLGDTTVDGIFGEGHASDKNRKRILSCPTVIIECSFLTEDCRRQAEQTKHVLWSDLRQVVLANPQTTFVLIHFSHRWSAHDIIEFFEREENRLPNVVPWVPEKGLYSCFPGDNQSSAECGEVWNHN